MLMTQMRMKSDRNMDEADEVEEDDDEEEESHQKKKKGRKDQFSNPVSRSSESVSCSPTNYDLMKEQIQAKCEYFIPHPQLLSLLFQFA